MSVCRDPNTVLGFTPRKLECLPQEVVLSMYNLLGIHDVVLVNCGDGKKDTSEWTTLAL